MVDQVVNWTLPSLGVNGVAHFTLVVTATQTMTNSDYAVIAEGGYQAIGEQPVQTVILPSPPPPLPTMHYEVYLPLVR